MTIHSIQRVLALAACVNLLASGSMAQQPVARPQVADVALAEGGVFSGKVVDAQGAPIPQAAVALHQAGKPVATSTTNAEGVFAVQGLRGGLYQVIAGNGVVAYRLWAPRTAPPTANRSALIVTGDEILAGQQCGSICPPGPDMPRGGGGVLGWMQRNPLLVGAGIAAAIAVPLAIDDDDDPAS